MKVSPIQCLQFSFGIQMSIFCVCCTLFDEVMITDTEGQSRSEAIVLVTELIQIVNVNTVLPKLNVGMFFSDKIFYQIVRKPYWYYQDFDLFNMMKFYKMLLFWYKDKYQLFIIVTYQLFIIVTSAVAPWWLFRCFKGQFSGGNIAEAILCIN